MKTLIVFFSLNGNTEKIAGDISERLGADLLRITPKKTYPDKGFKKFLVGGGDVVAKRRPELEPYSVDLSEYDRVIIAGPVWASNFVPPIGSFIDENSESLKDKGFAFIFCNAGGGSEKAVERLKKYLGIEGEIPVLSLVDPKTRPSEGNDEAINEFCGKLA